MDKYDIMITLDGFMKRIDSVMMGQKEKLTMVSH